MANRKLRTLERLILRGTPGGSKVCASLVRTRTISTQVRASWSPALAGGTPVKATPDTPSAKPSLCASWNPQRPAQVAVGSSRTLDTPDNPQGSANGDHLFLDLLHTPTAPKPPTAVGAAAVLRRPPAAPAAPDAAAQEALAALRAEVTVIQLGSQAATGEEATAAIARLQGQLRGLQAAPVGGGGQEAHRRQQVAAMEAEIRRLQEGHEVYCPWIQESC